MSYSELNAETRGAAERVLTEKQFVAYKLSVNGMSERDMAIHLGITRRAVRDRLAEADIKIHRAIREDAA